MDIRCPSCGETEALRGRRTGDAIAVRCESCGAEWDRSLVPRCTSCGSDDLQTAVMAIVEKGRGTQLSVVGTRSILLCSTCDADVLERYHRNRPNPLMPDELPTAEAPGFEEER